jgi:hypothetical protein
MNTMPAAIAVVTTLTSATLAAPQVRPGELTKAEVWIQNRARSEAIPVLVEQSDNAPPLRIQAAGTVPVSFGPTSIVSTRQSAQAWEYRSVTVGDPQAADAALASPGREGWEAAGVMPSLSGNGVVVLMKRPR